MEFNRAPPQVYRTNKSHIDSRSDNISELSNQTSSILDTSYSVFDAITTNTSHGYLNNSLYRDQIDQKKSQEVNLLMKENMKLKQKLEARSFDLCNAKRDIKHLQQEIVKQKLKIQVLEDKLKNISSSSVTISESNDVFNQDREKYNQLTVKYQSLLDQNKKLSTSNMASSSFKEENLTLSLQIESLKKEQEKHIKTINELKSKVRSCPVQETLTSQAELEKIKQVLTSSKEPSIETKKELEDIKADFNDLKNKFKSKQDECEEKEILIKTKNREIMELKANIDVKDDALARLSNSVMESKSRETELIEALRLERKMKPANNYDAKYSRGKNDY